MTRDPRLRNLALLLVAALLAIVGVSQRQAGHSAAAPTTVATTATTVADTTLARAIAEHRVHTVVSAAATIAKVLPDDLRGTRHQRLLVRLSSGATVLIAHNIDLASPIADPQPGEAITFKGEYVWNARGGVVHWTHHDPRGHQAAGWIDYHGHRYE